MSRRRIWIVADDYGLSPAVDDGILELLDQGRLSGTGCMTVFPDWTQEAARLREQHDSRAGIHLTLTDQPSLSGAATLARDGRLPSLAKLLKGVAMGQITDSDIAAELDAQLVHFEDTFGKPPLYIDGHQHVHFLPPARRWLKALVGRDRQPLPWLRGTPIAKYSPKVSFAKIATVRALASRFDKTMGAAGYPVSGPLAGFYDWRTGDDFAPTIDHAVRTLPDGGVLMVHPGHVDQTLRSRDILTDTRTAELRYLASDTFIRALDETDAVIATP
ncbi:MAG: ChbG/HpnK family deacetylase [Rhizobiaceae bacterium]